ncbi:DNA-binding transcriptional LysR family regulator [Kitasatospora kifunensis]|uniref:DNA-binding transcriptional LysR family regulator n=1 Tax=Kitasatospora kifunensis TaxID=58351 RepID=A0A7W7VW79_KITKI|nr:DNA-binding transcriptional LysR family regulator [Kitasatospora kifunensis]
MDLDLAQVRAFLATAEHRHFRHAAEELSLTQQALSKRIARLEAALGERLLERDGRTVELTAAGERFLEPARALLAAGATAVAAVRGTVRPLRLDVWGHLFAPLRTVRQVLDDGAVQARGQGLPVVEIGHGRDLPSVVGALLREEVEAGFGRYHALADRRARTLAHRLVRLEPVDVILGPGHPLAASHALRPTELRGGRLLLPAAPERLEFMQRFAERFGLGDALAPEANLGAEHFLAQLRESADGFTVLPADVPLPEGAAGAGLRAVPLVDPTPLYAWSLIWPSQGAHPGIAALLGGFAEVGRRNRWLEYRPGRDWLPEAEHAELTGQR